MWVICLYLYGTLVRYISILILRNLPQNELIGIVLYVELIRLHNGLYNQPLRLQHRIILIQPPQLLLIHSPNIHISRLLSMQLQMLFLLIRPIRLVTDHTMHHILLYGVVAVKVGVFIIKV